MPAVNRIASSGVVKQENSSASATTSASFSQMKYTAIKTVPPPQGLSQHRVQRALVHLFGHQPHADKNGNQQTHQRDRTQTQGHDNGLFYPDGNLPGDDRRRHHQQREEQQVVKHAVPHRFPERIQRHHARPLHFPLTSTAAACARSASTRSIKNSSSVALTCAAERIFAPAARS